MARIPLVERAFGQDRLAAVHRWVGFASFNLMLAHIALITWGYAAGDADRGPRRRSGTSPSATPACCSRWPARCAWSWSSSPASGPPAAGCATSRGTCCTSTPTSASGWRCRTSCGPARSSSSSPAAHRLLVDAVGRRPQRPCSSAGSGCRCARTLRHRLRVTVGRPRGAGRRLGLPDRAATWTGCRHRAGQFLIWRFLDRPGLDARASLLAVRRARRPQPADHRQGARRRQRAAAQPAPRHPGAGRGPARPAHRPGPHPPRGRPDRRRASASPRCAPSPRRCPTRRATPCCCTAYTERPLFARELDLLARERGCRCSWLPGRRRRARLVARRRRRCRPTT